MAQVQVNYFSGALMRQVTFQAIVPVDKLTLRGNPLKEAKTYPTLYLLHGIFGNYTDWMTGTRIERWAQENDLAVIMPSGDNSFYVDHEDAGAMYGEFIGRELVEMTRRIFPLSDKREDTFIGGLSMGGYGAVRNGLKYADTFGYIISLSGKVLVDDAPTSTNDTPSIIGRRSYYESCFGDLNQLIGSDKDNKALVRKLLAEGKSIPKIFMAIGTDDFLLEDNRKFHAFLTEMGVDVAYFEDTGAHEWDFWDRWIKKALDWLPLESGEKGINSGNVQ